MSSAELKTFEHSSLKVPYEILNKKFRVAQKTIDREISHVTHCAAAVERAAANGGRQTVTVDDLCPAVSALIDKLDTLKRRANAVVKEEVDAAVTIKKRLDHLKVYTEEEGGAAATTEHWRKMRVDRLLIDYLLRAGYYDSAAYVSERAGLQYMSNVGVFLAAKEVEDCLTAHQTAKCLEWCYDNKSKLRRLQSQLELLVRQQEFIELVRGGKRMDAIAYARKWFSALDTANGWNTDTGLQQVMSLLAFGPDTQVDEYKRLYEESRWTELIKVFRRENYRLYQLTHQSVFSACFQCGMSALKTPQCSPAYAIASLITGGSGGGRGGSNGGRQCPICQPEVHLLAMNLPYAHAQQSRIVCAISGEPLNENNPPMMLPNGMVYGETALRSMAIENDGVVVCPRTGAVTTVDQLQRVYVL